MCLGYGKKLPSDPLAKAIGDATHIRAHWPTLVDVLLDVIYSRLVKVGKVCTQLGLDLVLEILCSLQCSFQRTPLIDCRISEMTKAVLDVLIGLCPYQGRGVLTSRVVEMSCS